MQDSHSMLGGFHRKRDMKKYQHGTVDYSDPHNSNFTPQYAAQSNRQHSNKQQSYEQQHYGQQQYGDPVQEYQPQYLYQQQSMQSNDRYLSRNPPTTAAVNQTARTRWNPTSFEAKLSKVSIIQRWWRGSFCRQQNWELTLYLSKLRCDPTAQSHTSSLVFYYFNRHGRKVVRSSVTLTSWFRGYVERKQFKKVKRGLVLLQVRNNNLWRGMDQWLPIGCCHFNFMFACSVF